MGWLPAAARLRSAFTSSLQNRPGTELARLILPIRVPTHRFPILRAREGAGRHASTGAPPPDHNSFQFLHVYGHARRSFVAHGDDTDARDDCASPPGNDRNTSVFSSQARGESQRRRDKAKRRRLRATHLSLTRSRTPGSAQRLQPPTISTQRLARSSGHSPRQFASSRRTSPSVLRPGMGRCSHPVTGPPRIAGREQSLSHCLLDGVTGHQSSRYDRVV